jgi:hypothetical protein
LSGVGDFAGVIAITEPATLLAHAIWANPRPFIGNTLECGNVLGTLFSGKPY